MAVRVKICGLTRPKDAELAIELGADAIGFVLERSSPRFVGDGDLEWISALPPFPLKIAVLGVVDQAIPNAVFDLVQGVEWKVLTEPAPKRIHVIRSREGQLPEDVMLDTVPASAILLDGYSDQSYGGSGKRVDLSFAIEFVGKSKLPIILAGGLTPDNVGEIVLAVRPFAVDVSSGIEQSKGIKDPIKMRDFIQAAKGL